MYKYIFICLLLLSCRQNTCMGGDPIPPEVMQVIECAGEKWVEYVKSVNHVVYFVDCPQGYLPNHYGYSGYTFCCDKCAYIEVCKQECCRPTAQTYMHELGHAEQCPNKGEDHPIDIEATFAHESWHCLH